MGINIERIIRVITENKWWILLGIFFTFIFYLQESYGIVTSTYHYFFPEPVYIVKTRIENIQTNISGKTYIAKLDKENEGFISRYRLFDTCGDIALEQILVPADSPLLRWSNKDFVRVGQENLTYSISIFTKKKEGKIILKVYSYDTKFSSEKQIGSVKKIGASRDIEGLHQEIWEFDLALLSQNYEVLFDLIPNKDGEIKIECIGVKDCKITEIKYIISDFEKYIIDGKLEIKGIDIFGKTHKIQALLPQPNLDKVSIYEFDKSTNKFVKISLDNSTSATNIMFISELPCNKEGKIYIHPLGT